MHLWIGFQLEVQHIVDWSIVIMSYGFVTQVLHHIWVTVSPKYCVVLPLSCTLSTSLLIVSALQVPPENNAEPSHLWQLLCLRWSTASSASRCNEYLIKSCLSFSCSRWGNVCCIVHIAHICTQLKVITCGRFYLFRIILKHHSNFLACSYCPWHKEIKNVPLCPLV